MDGFFGIGIQELVLIAIVALIVLGPERLPATFREIAKFIRMVRNLTNEFTAQFGDDFKALEDLDPRRMLQREIESIDAEENKTTAKPAPAKTTTAKTTTTPKSTTATTPKPAASTTAKSTTSTTSTAKPAATQSSAKAEPTTATKATEAATATTNDAPAVSSEPVAATEAVTPVTETENRIAPPAVTTPAIEQSVAPVTHSGTTNGVVPKEVETTPPTNGTAVTIVANSVQASAPATQSE